MMTLGMTRTTRTVVDPDDSNDDNPVSHFQSDPVVRETACSDDSNDGHVTQMTRMTRTTGSDWKWLPARMTRMTRARTIVGMTTRMARTMTGAGPDAALDDSDRSHGLGRDRWDDSDDSDD